MLSTSPHPGISIPSYPSIHPSTHSTTVLHPYMTEWGLAKFQTFHQKNFGTLPILSSWSITRWSIDVGTLPRAALVLGINYRGYHGRGTTGILEGPKRRGERARMGKSSTDRLYWPTLLTDQELHLTSHLILCTSKPVLCTEKCNIIYFYHCCSLIIPGSQSTYKGIFYNTIRSPHFPFALSPLIHCHSNYSANSRTLT